MRSALKYQTKKYAILINGGLDKSNNNLRYWNNLSMVFKLLLENGFSSENINVIDSRLEKDIDISFTVEDKDELQIKIYPNPTKDIFNIDFGKGYESFEELEIYQMNGLLLNKMKISQQIEILNTTIYPSSVYNIKILKKDGTFKYHKFIKS